MHNVVSTVPFNENLHPDTSSFVNVLLHCSPSVITNIPLSPISLKLTSNSLNVVLPAMITVDITNTYSSVRCGQVNATCTVTLDLYI